jgi:hypothetical protein
MDINNARNRLADTPPKTAVSGIAGSIISFQPSARYMKLVIGSMRYLKRTGAFFRVSRLVL